MSVTVSPTRAVLEHLEAGASSLPEVATRTGLDPGVVALAIDRLVAAGYLHAERLVIGCPEDGCGACPSAAGGRADCGAGRRGTPDTHSSPVLITLGSARR